MTWNKKQILEFAKTIKKDKAKNTVKIGSKNYSLASVTQVLCSYLLNNTKSDYPSASVTLPSNQTGDNLNVKISKVNYIDAVKRCYTYQKNSKKAPNYVRVASKYNVKYQLFAYAIAKIVVWMFENNNKYPTYVLINSKDIPTPTPATTIFNNKNFTQSEYVQNTNYYCACNVLQLAFYKLTGIWVSESTIASWAGTTTQGTSHAGISTAVAVFNKKYNYNLKVNWKSFSDLTWKQMGEYLAGSNSFLFYHLLYRDEDGHYETPKQIRTDSDTLLIYNSLSGGYIESRSKTTQKRYINGISQKSVCIITK